MGTPDIVVQSDWLLVQGRAGGVRHRRRWWAGLAPQLTWQVRCLMSELAFLSRPPLWTLPLLKL